MYRNYADDTQIYITTIPGDYNPIQAPSKCTKQIKDWMYYNFLQSTRDKTAVIIFGDKNSAQL